MLTYKKTDSFRWEKKIVLSLNSKFEVRYRIVETLCVCVCVCVCVRERERSHNDDLTVPVLNRCILNRPWYYIALSASGPRRRNNP